MGRGDDGPGSLFPSILPSFGPAQADSRRLVQFPLPQWSSMQVGSEELTGKLSKGSRALQSEQPSYSSQNVQENSHVITCSLAEKERGWREGKKKKKKKLLPARNFSFFSPNWFILLKTQEPSFCPKGKQAWILEAERELSRALPLRMMQSNVIA